MLDSGLRTGEIETLKISNINFDKKYLIVDGKGNKKRAVPFGSNAHQHLIEYIKRRTPSKAKEKYLFLDRNNEPLGKNCIKMMFQDLKRYVPRVHAHLCRHTYATNFLISQKGDIYHLSKLLGYSEVKTTEIYLDIASFYSYIKRTSLQDTYIDSII